MEKRSASISAVPLAAWVILLLGSGCADRDETLFTRLTPDQTGISFVNVNHETEKSNILTYEYFYNGGGVALGDVNNDGLLDIYLSSNILENKLYLNKGNLKFEDITVASGTACETGWKTGVAMVDINQDGLLDIYVCRSASPDPDRRKNILLVNLGGNRFADKAGEFNLDDNSYSTQAAFFDYDHDDDLDAFVLNHSTLEISNAFILTRKNSDVRYPHVGNKLLRNDNGRFSDISDSAGVFGPASNYGLGVSLSDLNNDTWIDIYTGCDYTGRDRLLLNQQGKHFDDATEALSHISKFTMGTEIGDVNGDGWTDIFTVDMLPQDNRRQKQLFGSDRYDVFLNMVENGLHSQYMRNMLHLNNGDGSFSEVGQLLGISNTDWSWAALFADFDNDGIQDLFVSNGFKRDLTDNDFTKFKAFQEINARQRQGKTPGYLEMIGRLPENKMPNYCFKNSGNLAFTNVTREWGLDEPSLSHGAAYGDLDNDGDLDLVVNNMNDYASIYRNNSRQQLENNYVAIRLIATGQNRDAYGARVTVYVNNKKILREQLPVRGFQSSVDPTLHFGLGPAKVCDSVHILWPDGKLQVLKNVSANQRLVVRQDTTGHPAWKEKKVTLFEKVTAPSFTHRENSFIDFRIQALLPRMYSTEGPGLAMADVNGDGISDVFIGGARGQQSELWIGQKAGGFRRKAVNKFNDKDAEITDALFFDADGDADQDLYLATGGYEFKRNDPLLRDILLINDGRGDFTSRPLPSLLSNSSCVTAADVDDDGDQDLFVGSGVTPGSFPESDESVLLINDGNGFFSSTNSLPVAFRKGGMISAAVWADLNSDQYPELLVAGEWMPLMVFENDHGKLRASHGRIDSTMNGFWNSLAVLDVDRDGDPDFIAGNQGLNTQMKPTPATPVRLIYGDFDGNGSNDPIMEYQIMDGMYPYPTRDELTDQLPSFRKRFTNYASYANAQLADVLTPQELETAAELTVTTCETVMLLNDNGKLVSVSLPRELQISPVMSIAVIDVNEDGFDDLITGGNISATRARTGKMTGNCGFVFQNDRRGNFVFIPPATTGISVPGDVRGIVTTGRLAVFAVNNGPVRIFRLRG